VQSAPHKKARESSCLICSGRDDLPDLNPSMG